ncbi:hypothetical protein [Xanthomonas sp. 3058]|uniref:hypothetical protein n=1 Tax=Xanthomonas sp. 3058 TaxID=3035314 RepID=UPI00161E9913|nr:hypothetical protein [Xanthomonas sp. 3058]MBB5864802.1 hypothetical protein [Xanthomonas sp. 3058]
MKFTLELSASTLAIAASLFMASYANAAQQNSDGIAATSLSAIDRSAIEDSVTKQLRSEASKASKLPGQRKFDVSAHLSATESKLTIELGKNAVPETAGAASEDQCSEFATTARQLLRGEVSVSEYECTYGGKDIYFYHPEPAVVKKKVI